MVGEGRTHLPGLWQVIHEKAIWEATLADLTDTSTRGTTSFVFGDDAKVQEASKVLGLPLIHLTSDKIRESQRKKASENHPDKATDEKERTRRTERMKEINNAATTLLQYLNQKRKPIRITHDHRKERRLDPENSNAT